MRSRSGPILAAAAVILVPALFAILLTRSSTVERVPKVTQVLSALAEGSDRSQPKVAVDSPVGAALQGGKKLSIEFKRGRRVSLGTMSIPAIGLKTKFYEGVVDEAVKLGPGHWPGTPWPGEAGNSVFAGHRTTYTHPFRDLDLLDNGARVRISVRNGRTTTYRVFKQMVVPEEIYASVVLKQPSNKKARIVTLFACTPKGSRTHRIIVQAKAVPAAEKPAGKRGGDAMASS